MIYFLFERKKKFFHILEKPKGKNIMFISPINNSTRVSFGHIYSNAVDSVIEHSKPLTKKERIFTKKEEAKFDNLVTRASELNKSVITSSTSKGLVLLTANTSGRRDIHDTYTLGHDAKTNLEQLDAVVKEAEALEKTDLPNINPLRKGASRDSMIGKPVNGDSRFENIYNKTINGFNAIF